jgi:DNA-binding CsgD family transcriptional regulator
MIAAQEEHDLVAEQFLSKESQLTDSIMDCTEKYIIERVENEFNNQKHNDTTSRISRLKWGIIMVALIAFLLIALLTLAYLRRIHQTKAIIKDLENTKIDNYDYLLSQLDSKSAVIEQFLTNLVTLIKSITGNDAHNSTSQLAHQIKETITEVANDDFWNELRGFLDRNHGGIISKFEQMYSLKEKDLKFLELTCCGFSHAEIAIILNYSPKYVFSKRKILAQKMGLDMPLQDYVNSLMGKNQQD